MQVTDRLVAVGGIVISVVPLDPTFTASNPAEDGRISGAIKFRLPSEGK
jgi:hypothetical protein